MRSRSALPLTLVLMATAGLGACGSKPAKQAKVATTQSVTIVPQTTQPASPAAPAGVPDRGAGPADAASTRVIRAWLAALRKGQIHKAASYFAVPSKVQNGTPVLTISSKREAVAFNDTFPCGAKARTLRAAARGFTVVDFVLTERRHGDCMGAAGQRARSAIRVKNNRIVGWYRLADPTVPQTPPATDQGGGVV